MNFDQDTKKMTAKSVGASHVGVSSAVIRRLPRYYRYLRELIREGTLRISSNELSHRMHVTASQIRQDLNCFGGFGQQGYGYNVNYLYTNICELLGVSAGIRAVIVGAGDLGRALVRSPMFERRGVDILSMFDIDEALIGREFGGVTVRNVAELERFLSEVPIDMAVLTVPKVVAREVAERLSACGIAGIWNFTGLELEGLDEGMILENVHLGDSLMILNYQISERKKLKNSERK